MCLQVTLSSLFVLTKPRKRRTPLKKIVLIDFFVNIFGLALFQIGESQSILIDIVYKKINYSDRKVWKFIGKSRSFQIQIL